MSVEPAATEGAQAMEPAGPWLGLQSYEERHSSLFFGRETDRDTLFRLVKRDVLTVLYGVSGLGKTSLLNAGLFPLLRERFYLPIPIRLGIGGRDGPDPVVRVKEAIATEVAARCAGTPGPREGETLWEYFHGTKLRDREDEARALAPVLVFDQFEEIIRDGQAGPGREALYEELSDLVENYIPTSVRTRLESSGEQLPFRYDTPKVKVIVALREDYLGQFQELQPLIPSLMRNVHRLKPMSGTQAVEAVINPARRAGLHIADDVAERIVRISAGELEGGADTDGPLVPLDGLDVESALLSLFCAELNKARADRDLPTITMELARGERGGILSGFYESRTRDLQLEVRRFIEDELLTKEGHRKSAVEEDLGDGLKAEVNRLIDLRLLRRETPPGRPSCVELMHDVLAEPILKSRSERRAQEAVEEERKRLRRDNERLELERGRTLARVYRVATTICLVLAAVAWWQWSNAKSALDVERALRLAADAIALGTSPDGWVNSALLATESVKLRANPETTSAWAEAIGRVLLRKELGLKQQVTALAFDINGRHLAAASDDNVTRVWDLESGSAPLQLPHHARVSALAFSPDGERLVAVGGDDVAHMWDVQRGEQLVQLPHQGRVRAIALSPDGKRLTTAGENDVTRAWDIESGKEIGQPRQEKVTTLTLSPDGRRAAGASPDGRRAAGERSEYVSVWDLDGGNKVLPRLWHSDTVVTMAFSRDGRRLATASFGSVQVWDVESGGVPVQIQTPPRHITAMAFSADGKRLATALQADTKLQIWDTERGTLLMEWYSLAKVSALAISGNGRELMTVHTGEGVVRVWAEKSITERIHLPLEFKVASVALSPDEKHLTAVGEEGAVREWDLMSGAEVSVRRREPENLAKSVAYSPNGKRRVTVSASGTGCDVQVIDVETGKPISPALPHPMWVTAVAFSPDGRRLATASGDGARVWDLENGEKPVLLPHQKSVAAVAFSVDGTRLATASSDSRARVWDWKGRRELIRLPHRRQIRALVFSPMGERLVSVDFDNVVRVWPLKADEMVTVACDRLPRNLSPDDRKVFLGNERHPATCRNLQED